MGGCSAEDVSPGGGLRVPLPTAKDALVTLSLKDGNGGCKLFKSHVGTLAKHSELFAAAMRQGTKLKVQAGAYALDCSAAGVDKMLEYMRSTHLSSNLTHHDMAALRKLGGYLEMSGEFWMAMALHPTSCGRSNGGGGTTTNGAHRHKGILKHGSGGGGGFGGGGGGVKRKNGSTQQGTNGACTSTAAAPQAPPLSPRAKAYRKVLVDDMADCGCAEQLFFTGEWYGRPAEMNVVCTYDAEVATPAEQEHSSNAHSDSSPLLHGYDGGSKHVGTEAAAAAEAAEAANALLGGPPTHMCRFALLEFAFDAS